MKPLVIAGPSGSGKGSLIRKIISEYPHYFELSVSSTTRQPRQEDKEGVTYFFMSKENFKQDIKEKKFLEYAEFSGNYYGTNIRQVNSTRERGKVCILEIELLGAKQIFNSELDCNYLYILPPSL